MGEYDPFAHRAPANPSSSLTTMTHFLKGSIGTGILAMHQAYSNAGLYTGVGLSLLTGFICLYCLRVMFYAQYLLCKKKQVPLLTYPDAMQYALEIGPEPLRGCAHCAAVMVDLFLIFYQVGICSVYTVFIAESFKQVVDYYYVTLDIRIHSCICMIPIVLICCITDINKLSPFATIANVVNILGLSIILYYACSDLPPVSSRPQTVELSKYFMFLGTILFALVTIGVIVSLENNMEEPADFVKPFGVLNFGFFFTTVLYAVVGFFGYLKYGEESALGSITLNIPQDELLAQSVKVMIAVGIIVSYALQFYVAIEILLKRYLNESYEASESPYCYELTLRFSLMGLALVAALAVPKLGLFISFVGVFCVSALTFLFPGLMDICVRWPDQLGPCNIILFRDIFIIICGFISLFVGTYVSIKAVVDSYK